MLEINSPVTERKTVESERMKPSVFEMVPNSKLPNGSLRSIIITFSLQVGTILIGAALYLRVHQIDLIALFNHAGNWATSGFTFISTDLVVATIFEVLCWAALATTLRWIHTGIIASKKADFNPVRHLIEWSADLLATPIIAGVIVYGLQSSAISFGQNLNLSLRNADIYWFTLLGFLLGFFSGAPRSILSRMRSRALPQNREGQKRKLLRKNRASNHAKKNQVGENPPDDGRPGKLSQ